MQTSGEMQQSLPHRVPVGQTQVFEVGSQVWSGPQHTPPHLGTPPGQPQVPLVHTSPGLQHAVPH